MKKINNPSKYTMGHILSPLFFIILLASMSFAQDLETKAGQELFFSANILSVAANINFEQMSISYNGLSGSRRYLFQSGRDLYTDESHLKFDGKLKQMTRYFLKYFNFDDFSTDDADSNFSLKSKVDTGKMKPNDFEFNLSLNIEYDNNTNLKMNAIKLESSWLQTYVNAVYHYEKSEFELGLSSVVINAYLLDGMKLEFQANPVAGSGAVLLTMSL